MHVIDKPTVFQVPFCRRGRKSNRAIELADEAKMLVAQPMRIMKTQKENK